MLILPYQEQAQTLELWGTTRSRGDLTLEFYAQPAAVRNFTLPIYACPSRRKPGITEPGELRQDTGPEQASGAYADYAACAGNQDGGNADYHDGGDNLCEPGTPGNPCANGMFWRFTTAPGFRLLKFQDCLDGLSNTVFIGEKHVREIDFGGPRYPTPPGQANTDRSIYNGDHFNAAVRKLGSTILLAKTPKDTGTRFGSFHPGVCQFLLGDSSVRALRVTTSGTVLDRLAARKDGNPVTDF